MKEAIKLVEKALEILKSEEKKEKVVLNSLKPGETFMIGKHEFIVLEQNYETTNVISKTLWLKMFGLMEIQEITINLL